MSHPHMERISVVVIIVLVMGIGLFLQTNRESVTGNISTTFASSGAVNPLFACPSASSIYISASGDDTKELGTFTRVTNSPSIPSVTVEDCAAIIAGASTAIENTKTRAQEKAKASCEHKRPAVSCKWDCKGTLGDSSCTAGEPTAKISVKHFSSTQQGSFTIEYIHTFSCRVTASATASGSIIATCEKIFGKETNPVSVAPEVQ